MFSRPRQAAAVGTLEDPDLARLAASGDRGAFGELARRHSGPVRALLRRMGADPATADDLAQDALVQAFQRIGDYRGEGSFAGWLKRIAARLYIRRARGKLRLETPLDDDDTALGVSAGEGASAARIDLDEALKTLSEIERVCVTLCHGGGWSHSEIAEALNAPLGTVKSHVKRGLDKLKLRLSPPEGGAAGRYADV